MISWSGKNCFPVWIFRELEFIIEDVQGVPFEKSQKEMAVELKRCIFDRVLVKPKCVWEAVVFSMSADFFIKLKYIDEKWPNISSSFMV